MSNILKAKDFHNDFYLDGESLNLEFLENSEASNLQNNTTLRLKVTVLAFGQIIKDAQIEKKDIFTVGTHKKVDLQIPSQSFGKTFNLLKLNDDGSITLNVSPEAKGYLKYNQSFIAVENQEGLSKSGHKETLLPLGAKGVLQFDSIVIYFESINQNEVVPPFSFKKQLKNPYFLRWLCASVGFHLLLLLLLLFMPKADVEEKAEKVKKKFQKIVVQNKKIKKYQPIAVRVAQSRGNVGKEGSGAKAGGKEGRRGKGVTGKSSKAKVNKSVNVNQTGVLSFFSKSSNNSVLNDLIGSGSNINNTVNKLGKNNARRGLAGETQVRQGKGIRGSGSGGGNTKTASIGQNGLGTKGKGGGKNNLGGLSDFGTGNKKVAVSASIDDEEVYIEGNIPKSEIARIIRNHLGQIKSCYERQLVRQPGLKGKVVVDFIIGLQGRVTSTKIQETTMKNSSVESCIQRVVRRMPFPKPGGGVVNVIYPFAFSLAG